MRTLVSAALLCACASQAFAAPLSRDDVVSKVKADGFQLISKAEPQGRTWDVWASKDGLPYEMKLDAQSGSVVTVMPVDGND